MVTCRYPGTFAWLVAQVGTVGPLLPLRGRAPREHRSAHCGQSPARGLHTGSARGTAENNGCVRVVCVRACVCPCALVQELCDCASFCSGARTPGDARFWRPGVWGSRSRQGHPLSEPPGEDPSCFSQLPVMAGVPVPPPGRPHLQVAVLSSSPPLFWRHCLRATSSERITPTEAQFPNATFTVPRRGSWTHLSGEDVPTPRVVLSPRWASPSRVDLRGVAVHTHHREQK